MTNSLQVFQHGALFGRNLRHWRQMLQAAAATNTEMRAARCDPIRRRLQYRHHLRFVELPMATCTPCKDTLTRQCSAYEYGLAVVSGHTTAIVAQVDDIQLKIDQGTNPRSSQPCILRGLGSECKPAALAGTVRLGTGAAERSGNGTPWTQAPD